MEENKQQVNVTNVEKAVWLLKVPKFLSKVWQHADTTGTLGTVKIEQKGLNQEMSYKVDSRLSEIKCDGQAALPTEYNLIVNTAGIYQVVLHRTNTEGENDDDLPESKIVGKVTHKVDLRVRNEQKYLDLKRRIIEHASTPHKQPIFVQKVVRSYRPVSEHPEYRLQNAKKKEEGKRARADPDHVKEMLFAAFEKHQYYSLKNLADITQQPVVYVKEIMREIGRYNSKDKRFQHLWELKPEYRHYSKRREEDTDSK